MTFLFCSSPFFPLAWLYFTQFQRICIHMKKFEREKKVSLSQQERVMFELVTTVDDREKVGVNERYFVNGRRAEKWQDEAKGNLPHETRRFSYAITSLTSRFK